MFNSYKEYNKKSSEDDCFSTQIQSPTSKSLRESSTLYDKSRCIICREERLRPDAVKETTKNVFGVAKNLEGEQFFFST